MSAEKILQEVFGYSSFRPLQREAISALESGRDCSVILPTGGGKSLCYQVPALLFDGVTIVVSPLISLMKDQVDSLRGNGVAAEVWNSSLSQQDSAMVVDLLLSGQLKLLYVAPERFSSAGFEQIIRQVKVSLIAIDEAHCVSEWGHDFRPDYRLLSKCQEWFPSTPRIALTASATPQVADDIRRSLALRDPVHLQGSFDRPNLYYEVRQKAGGTGEILSYLRSAERGSGIIYCGSRKRTEEIASELQAAGMNALPYHAGLSPAMRADHQTRFIRDEVPIVVATVAFGMGIDKPNIRFVIHHDMPKSLENYYQETGRAGRDGLPSDCILLHSYSDWPMLNSFIEQLEDPEEKKRQRQKLQRMNDFAQRQFCRRKQILGYFGERYPKENCEGCDVCTGDRKKVDATIVAQKMICAVLRLKERVGLMLVIDVLRGMDNQKVRQQGGQSLSVFGIAKELSKDYLRVVGQQLLAEGYLQLSGDRQPILKVSEVGKEAVLQRKSVFLVLPDPKRAQTKERAVKRSIDYSEGLFEELRKLRKKFADEAELPPYAVFADRTLQEMAYYIPRDLPTLGQLSGIGQHRLAAYGSTFLQAIMEYAEANNLPSKEPPQQVKAVKKKGNAQRSQQVESLAKSGLDLEGIAAELGLKASTVSGYLERLMEEGSITETSAIVPDELVDLVLPHVQGNPEVFLRALKDATEQEREWSWEQLRLARARAQYLVKREGCEAKPEAVR